MESFVNALLHKYNFKVNPICLTLTQPSCVWSMWAWECLMFFHYALLHTWLPKQVQELGCRIRRFCCLLLFVVNGWHIAGSEKRCVKVCLSFKLKTDPVILSSYPRPGKLVLAPQQLRNIKNVMNVSLDKSVILVFRYIAIHRYDKHTMLLKVQVDKDQLSKISL